ncbi:hypothetical protein [Streptomyces sp. NPDC058254]|uniref:hypothetical protein n=1 Tax=Streptomyces sp. NPDC058254 TaxID=3346406 RepID=UPI0036E43CDE
MPDRFMPVPAGNTALIADEPSDLAVAVTVARRMLATFSTVDHGDHAAVDLAHGALTESLRILLRAIDRAAERQKYEAVRRSVDAQFPAVAAFLAADRVERGEGQ